MTRYSEERTRQSLARSLTARMEGAACEGRAALWDQGEKQLRRVPASIGEGAAARMSELCQDCPVREVCGEWARAERYSGYAAGTTWVEGRPGGALRAERHTQWLLEVDAVGA